MNRRKHVVWMKRVILGLGVAAVVVIIAAAALVVRVWRPHIDHSEHADAVVVLSGDQGERLGLAQRLLDGGVSSTLVLAGQPDLAEDVSLCQGGRRFEVVCLRPDPDSTRAEARSTAKVAASRHWKSIVVVTTTTHVSRARLLFSRCFDGPVKVVGAKPPYGGAADRRAKVHEWLGLVYAEVWSRGC